MADEMDVDTNLFSGNTLMDDKTRRMHRNSSASDVVREDGLISLSDSRQQEVTEAAKQDLGGRPSKAPAASHKKAWSLPKFLKPYIIGSDNHQRCENMKMGELFERYQNLQGDLEALKQTNGSLLKAQRTAEDNVVHLISDVESTRKINEKLEGDKKNARIEIARLRSLLDAANGQLQAHAQMHRQEKARLQAEISSLAKTSEEFRDMLIPVSEKQASDADIMQRFASLRSDILRLVRQTWSMAFKDGVDTRLLSGDQQEFLKSEIPATYDRLRQVVFSCVYRNILGSQRYFLKEELENLEQLFFRAEGELSRKSSQENCKPFIEWRNATFKVTEPFRDHSRHWSSCTQDQIWNFLGPLQTKSADAEQNGRKRLKTICDDAVELSLMIRQLNNIVLVENLAYAIGQPLSKLNHIAEEMACVEANDSHQPGVIAYVIAGALIRPPQGKIKDVIVLEKAHVAVYR